VAGGFNAGAVVSRLIIETKRGFQKPLQDSKRDLLDFGAVVRKNSADIRRMTIAMGAAGAAALAMTRNMTRQFGDLDKGMRRATAAMSETPEQFVEMRKMVRDLSKEINLDATELTNIFRQLGYSGIEVVDSMMAFPYIARFVKGGMMEIDEGAKEVIRIMKGFNIGFEHTESVVNQLSKGFMSSVQEMEDMAQAMSYVAGASDMAGAKLHEVIAILAVMADVGFKGTRAGRALRQAYVRLLSPVEETKRALRRLNIEIYDSNDQIRPFIEYMSDIIDYTSQATDKTHNWAIETLFGTRALTGMSAITRIGSEGLRAFSEEIRTNTTAVDQLVRKQMEGYNEQLGITIQRIKDLARLLGRSLAPRLLKIYSMFRVGLDILIEYTEAHMDLARKAMTGVLAFGLLMTAAIGALGAIFAFKIVIVGWIAVMKVAVSGVLALAAALNTAMLSSLLPVAAVIGGLYLMRVAWAKNWGGMRDTLNEFGRGFTDSTNQTQTVFREGLQRMREDWNWSWRQMGIGFRIVLNELMAQFSAMFVVLGNITATYFAALMINVKALFKQIELLQSATWKAFAGDWVGVYEDIIASGNVWVEAFTISTDAIEIIWEDALAEMSKKFETDYVSKIVELNDSIPGIIGSTWEDIKEIAKQDFALLADLSEEAWEAIKNAVVQKVNDIIASLRAKFPEFAAAMGEFQKVMSAAFAADDEEKKERKLPGWIETTRQYLQESVDEFKIMPDVIEDVSSEMNSNIKTFFVDALHGNLKKSEDYFRAWGESVLSIVVNVMTKLAEHFLFLGALKIIGSIGSMGASVADPATVPSGQTGIPFVSHEGLYRLHEGESVKSKADTAEKETPEITMVNMVTSEAIATSMMDQMPQDVIVNTIASNIAGGGIIRRAMEGALARG